MAYAHYACELIDLVVPEADGEPAHFDLLRRALALWEEGRADPGWVARAFELRLLRLAGLAPALESCVACGTPRPEEGGECRLDARAGGLVCGACRIHADGEAAAPVSRAAAIALRRLARLPGSRLADLPADPALLAELEGHLDRYLAHHLERAPRSRAFLEAVRRGNGGAGRIPLR